jgi:dTDP-4-amino-4,6-dideoxygalactose transaminase
MGSPERYTTIQTILSTISEDHISQSIPQTDPRSSYHAQRREIDNAISRVLEGGRYILGDEVAGFEVEFSAYLGVSHTIGLSSGTDALCLALRACGIGPGDAVITVSLTAVATVAATEMAGAFPMLVDIDPISYTMDPEKLEDTIRKNYNLRLKAIVPVHLYGRPAKIAPIVEIGRRYGLRVIEDCAQSHGASVNDRKTGTWGDAAAFSFYPTKNLGALGDGGAAVTSDTDLAKQIRLLREYGWQDRYISKIKGVNSRLDELQAAILRVKLPWLDEGNGRRRQIAALYDEKLSKVSHVLPPEFGSDNHVYHQYVLRSQERNALQTYLKEHGVGTLVHYPAPVHTQPAYLNRVGIGIGGMSHTERACTEVLSLPMYPHLTDEQALRVCDVISKFTTNNA